MLSRIDISKWQDFVIGDLFEKLDLKKKDDFRKALDVSDVRNDEFNTPLVNAKHGNCGIMYYGRQCDFETEAMTLDIVQNGALATGDVYAEPEETGVLEDAYLVKSKYDLTSVNTLLFLATVIERAIKDKFSYDDKCIWRKVKQLCVKLPCDEDGLPDWAYMDEYMANTMKDCESTLSNLYATDKMKHQVKFGSWKRFHLYDDGLFDIDMGTKLDKMKMTQTEPDVNFVGRANANNGVTAWVDSIPGITPYAAGNMTLSLGGEYLGSCFVQQEQFYTSQNVIVLIPKWDMPFEVKQFIATMIFKESRLYYKAFIDELNRHIKRDFSFYLPVTESGEPDWAYMVKFMRKAEAEAEADLDALVAVI